jgi:hypothetical protein
MTEHHIGDLTWWAWLTKVARSSRHLNSSARFEAVGHRRALSMKWALTVGMWGGVFTRDQIWGVARPRSTQVWTEFLRSWKVRARVDHSLWPEGRPSRAKLVQRVSQTFGELVPTAGRGEALHSVARAFHVLPVDVAVMAHSLEVLLDERGQQALDYWGDPHEEDTRKQHWDEWDPLPAGVMEHWLRVLAGRDDPHGPNGRLARDFPPGSSA